MIGFGNREVAWSARTPLITGYVLATLWVPPVAHSGPPAALQPLTIWGSIPMLVQHNVLEVWGPSGPWLLDGGPLGSSAHTLDWCAFALDGLKNVTNQRTDGQGISRRRMVKDKYTKPCHRQNKKTNQTKKAKQTKNIWDLSSPLRLLRHTLINLLKRFPTFISYQSLIVNYQLSIINHNHQLSIINLLKRFPTFTLLHFFTWPTSWSEL